MNFLENLQSIIKFDFPSLKNITLKNLGLKITAGNNNRKIINNGKMVVINIGKLDNKERTQVQEMLRNALEEGTVLLEENSNKLVQEVKEIEGKGENIELLKFFQGKIPDSDLEILRASLVIKAIYEMHSPVNNLIDDISRRYGRRGANISNLCTAGYFSTVIKPLYEEMSKLPNFSTDKFKDRYNVIVEQYTFAVFVSNRKSYKDTKKEIVGKIELNKKYGIRQLNIHGIGRNNVTKVKTILSEIKKTIHCTAEIEAGNSFINVKITF